jgi:probable phosphoglycerate mutase
MKIFVIRHAESQWNVIGKYQGILNPDLTELGIKQAKALAKALKNKGIKIIFTSPLKRTKKTAEILAEELGVPLYEDERIIEIDHGVWSGLKIEEVQQKFPEMYETWLKTPWNVKFPQGESLEEVYKRVKDFLNFLKEEHGNENIAIVSHTVPIRTLYCAFLELPLNYFWSFGCDNASYSILLWEENKRMIFKLNITSHLEEENLHKEELRAL